MPQPSNTRAVATQPQQQQTSAVAVINGPPAQVAATVHSLFEDPRIQAKLGDALAGAMPTSQFLGMAASYIAKHMDSLGGATVPSVLTAIMDAATWGLPLIAGRAYIVPYTNRGVKEAQFQAGYQGIIDKLQADRVAYVEAGAVRLRDHFTYERGTDAFLRHVPWSPSREDLAAGDTDPGEYTHFWAQAKLRGEDRPKFDVMTWAEVEVIRRRAPSSRGNGGPWATDYGEMGKKTVLKRLAKTLPMDLRVMQMLEREDERDYPHQPPPATDGGTSQLRARLQQRVAPQYAAAAQAPADQPADQAEQAPDQPTTRPPPPPTPPPAPAPVAAPAPPAPQDATQDAEAANEAPSAPIWPDGPPDVPGVGVPCGANATMNGSTTSCTMRRGHRGDHTDGRHDWPRR